MNPPLIVYSKILTVAARIILCYYLELKLVFLIFFFNEFKKTIFVICSFSHLIFYLSFLLKFSGIAMLIYAGVIYVRTLASINCFCCEIPEIHL